MKKLVLFFLIIAIPSTIASNDSGEDRNRFFTAFTAGYAFKNDSKFTCVYGHGMANAITADFCYYPWEVWGLGAKLSYWRAKGHTTFLRQCSLIQEVPFTIYLKRIKQFKCDLTAYASLGLGFAWLKEKSYLGTAHTTKAIGELELGLQYPVWRCINITGAFRYLFPPQTQSCEKIDVGGIDLRAGIGFSF